MKASGLHAHGRESQNDVCITAAVPLRRDIIADDSRTGNAADPDVRGRAHLRCRRAFTHYLVACGLGDRTGVLIARGVGERDDFVNG